MTHGPSSVPAGEAPGIDFQTAGGGSMTADAPTAVASAGIATAEPPATVRSTRPSVRQAHTQVVTHTATVTVAHRRWFTPATWAGSLSLRLTGDASRLKVATGCQVHSAEPLMAYADVQQLDQWVDALSIDDRSGALVSLTRGGGGNGLLLSVTGPKHPSEDALSTAAAIAARHDGWLHVQRGDRITTSLHLPSGGPGDVAAAYAKYRHNFRGPVRRPRRANASDPNAAGGDVRIDLPFGSPEPALHQAPGEPVISDRVLLGTVDIGAMVPDWVRPSIDEHLQASIAAFDFIIATGSERYVYAIDAPAHRFRSVTAKINARLNRRLPAARLQWGEPSVAPVDRQRLPIRMADLVARSQLAGPDPNATPTVLVNDTQRLDLTEAAPPSRSASGESPAERLESEIRSLGRRLRRQSHRLRHTAMRTRLD